MDNSNYEKYIWDLDLKIKEIEIKHFGLDTDYIKWVNEDRPPIENVDDLIKYFDDLLQAFKVATNTPHALDYSCWCHNCKLTNFSQDRTPWGKN